MKRLMVLLLTIVSVIVFQSCSKEGPAGPAGVQGPQGAQGTQGSQGNTGTANVTYSAWFNPVWTNNGTNNIFYNKAATGITQTIVDQGTVLAYVKFADEGGLVRALPAVTFSGQVIWSYAISAGNIRIIANPTNSASSLSAGINMQFRYVIIPGAVAGGRLSSPAGSYTTAQLKELTYEEVVKLFGIPENEDNTK